MRGWRGRSGGRTAIAQLRRRLGLAVMRTLRLTNLRRVRPYSYDLGWDRGHPIDRTYIERFLGGHAADVRGEVMEVKDAGYARRFGAQRVTGVTVVDNDPGNPDASLIVDLCTPEALPAARFDCIILT